MATDSYSWLEVFHKDYSASKGQTRLLTTQEFNGDQYIGIGRPNTDGSAQVLRRSLSSTNKWLDCTPIWPTTGQHANPGGDAMVLAVVNNELFVGNDKGAVYFTSDGSTWNLAYEHGSAAWINAIAEFRGNMYIAASGDIVRGKIYPTGIIFTQVVGNNAKYPSSFGAHDLYVLEVFDKHLYAGVGKDNDKGIQLWRTSNGTSWELFHDLKRPPLVAELFPGHVHAMKSFKKHLYIGGYHGNYLFRTDGSNPPSANHWERIESKVASSGDIVRLEEYQGHLYMGLSYITHTPSQPEDLIYRSSDGLTWKQVPGAPQHATRNIAISEMKELNGKLYVGDFGPGLGQPSSGDVLRIWEMQGPLLQPLFIGQIPDLHEKNDTPNSALNIQMDTKNKYSHNINDLSLGVSDVDFLRIKFSTDQKSCQSGNKKIAWFGGLCTAEVGNSFLRIKILQETCVPLKLQMLHTNQTVFDHNEYLNGNDVYIECPDYLLKGDLFTKISNFKGNPGFRYAVHLELSEGFFLGKCREPLYRFWEYQMPPWQRILEPRQRFTELEDLINNLEKDLDRYREKLDRYGIGEMNHGIGKLAMVARQDEVAEDRLRMSIEAFGELGLRGKRASALRDLGRLYSRQGNASNAEEQFAEAMELHRSEEDLTEFALDALAVAKHVLESSPEEALTLASDAYSVFKDRPKMLHQVIEVLMLQSKAFSRLNHFEPAVAAALLGRQLSAQTKDADRLSETDDQAAALAEIMGVRKYMRLETALRDKAVIILESRLTESTERFSLYKR